MTFEKPDPARPMSEPKVLAGVLVETVGFDTRPGDRGILLQVALRDQIPREESDELWASVGGERQRREYDCDHDLVDHGPARADQTAYLMSSPSH